MQLFSRHYLHIFLRHKHHTKAYKKQRAAKPYCLISRRACQHAAEPRAYAENKYNAEIGYCFFKYFFIPHAEVCAKRLCARAHIAYAHGAGVGVPPHLMKGLHLVSADERNKRVCKRLNFCGQKTHRKKQKTDM